MRGQPSMDLRYTRIIGTGGIGTGIFFKLDGMHTIGRNESRSGKLMPYRDYCKLHIVFHYIAAVLRAGRKGHVQLIPIGMVGDDAEGLQLISKMREVGMEVAGIRTSKTLRTLFSVCFQYPDNTGGNITSSNGASYAVSPRDIERVVSSMDIGSGGELFLAVPEVPVASRVRLLEEGRQRKAFNAASLLPAEVNEFCRCGGFELIDYLAINIEEARAIAGIEQEKAGSAEVAEQCITKLSAVNHDMLVSITAGAEGSYCFKGNKMIKVPSLDVEVVSTAGAGDAYMAGVIIGLCCGLPFMKETGEPTFGATPVASAVELGTLIASMAITAPDTINEEICSSTIKSFTEKKGIVLAENLNRIVGI
ncbi:MAG: carbohydrate kinase family protein [Bacillota bacterium]